MGLRPVLSTRTLLVLFNDSVALTLGTLRQYWPPRMHSFAYGITVRQRPGDRGLPRGLAPFPRYLAQNFSGW